MSLRAFNVFIKREWIKNEENIKCHMSGDDRSTFILFDFLEFLA